MFWLLILVIDISPGILDSSLCFIQPGILNDVTCIDGDRNDNPLQYSCLENPVDRGAYWAAVHRVAQSWTWMKWLRIHACNLHRSWISRVTRYSFDILLSKFGTSLLFHVQFCFFLTLYKFLRRQVKWSGIPISWRIFHSLLWSTQSKVLA